MSENRSYTNRKLFFYFLFGATGLAFIVKLFLIQIVDDKYKQSADNNALPQRNRADDNVHPGVSGVAFPPPDGATLLTSGMTVAASPARASDQ